MGSWRNLQVIMDWKENTLALNNDFINSQLILKQFQDSIKQNEEKFRKDLNSTIRKHGNKKLI